MDTKSNDMDTLEYIKKSISHYYEVRSIGYAKRLKTNGALFGKFYFIGLCEERVARYFIIINKCVKTYPTEKRMLCELNKL